jgi:ATP phosphoribosyltransferase regulatory subunit
VKKISRPLGLFAGRTFFILKKGVKRMKWNRSLPSGTKDKLFKEANGAYEVEKEIHTLLKKRGYQRIETPVIEFADVFHSKNHNEKDYYRFFDQKGRLLVLRPDMTLPIGRVIATAGLNLPLKLSYSGKIFRFNDEMLGEKNEVTQAGIELIGYASLKAEIECITCAVDVLEALKIPNFHFELGHAKIFRLIIAKLQLNEAERAELQLYFSNKSLTDLRRFTKQHPSELDAFIRAIPTLFGEVDQVTAAARSLLPKDSELLPVIEELEILARMIQQQRSLSLTVDLGLIVLMDYYTGVLFSGYADLVPETFLQGGRYDQLTEQFGYQNVPAVGWGINLDTLVSLLYRLDQLASLEQPTTLVFSSLDQMKQARQLVSENEGYQLSLFDSLAETQRYAQQWHYQQIIQLTAERTTVIKVGDDDDTLDHSIN